MTYFYLSRIRYKTTLIFLDSEVFGSTIYTLVCTKRVFLTTVLGHLTALRIHIRRNSNGFEWPSVQKENAKLYNELSADDKKKLQEQKTLLHDQKQKNLTEKQNYRKTKSLFIKKTFLQKIIKTPPLNKF